MIIEKYDIELSEEMHCIDPAGYLKVIVLLKNCRNVMIDICGLQKEANFFENPCLSLRDATERVELVDTDYYSLVGAETEQIVNYLNEKLISKNKFEHLFNGNGKAGVKLTRTFFQYK